MLDGSEHFVTTSIGIALAEGGELADDLIRDADAAMNRAKERGRARYELFDVGLRGRAMSRLRVENDLRRALDRDELTLDYQPVVSLRDRSIVSVEALIRWEHPVRGRRLPGRFHPGRRGERADRADRTLGARPRLPPSGAVVQARPDAPPIAMSVNLSAVQVANHGLARGGRLAPSHRA